MSKVGQIASPPNFGWAGNGYRVVLVANGRKNAIVKPNEPKMDWSEKSKLILPSRGKELKNSDLRGRIEETRAENKMWTSVHTL